MQRFSEVLWRRKWVVLGALVFVLLLSPLILRLITPTYQAQATLMLAHSDTAKDPLVAPVDLPSVIEMGAVVSAALHRLQLAEPVDLVASRLSVKADDHSNVVSIAYRDKNPSNAMRVPNAVATEVVSYYRNLATRQYDELISALRQQRDAQVNRIHALDEHLSQLAQQDVVAGSADGQDTIASQLNELIAQRGQAYATQVADEATASRQSDQGALRDVVDEQAAESDPYYQTLRAGTAKDAAEYQFEKAGYTEAFPGLPGLADKVAREQTATTAAEAVAVRQHLGASQTRANILLYQERAHALAAGDAARVHAIDGQIDDFQKRLADLGTTGVAANAYRLQREGAEATYQQISTRLASSIADESEAASLSSLFVLESADAAYPRMPELALVLIVSLVIVGLAIGSAYAAEALDPRIRSTADVESLYGTSHIGSVR